MRAPARRAVGPEVFAGITPVPVAAVVAGDEVEVTFEGVLTPEQARAVREWMTSSGDEDFRRRATLRKAAASGAINLDAMTAAYVLGDPMPEPMPPGVTATALSSPRK